MLRHVDDRMGMGRGRTKAGSPVMSPPGTRVVGMVRLLLYFEIRGNRIW